MSKCVSCGKETTGTYGQDETIPTCFGCYQDGQLAVWLRAHRPEKRVANHVRFKVERVLEDGVKFSIWANGTLRGVAEGLSQDEFAALCSALAQASNIWFVVQPLEEEQDATQ